MSTVDPVCGMAVDVAGAEHIAHRDGRSLDAGESIKAVSEYLGHADAGFTLRV